MFTKRINIPALVIVLGTIVLPQQVKAYYNVGEEISQETRARLVEYCANAQGSSSFSDLLLPGPGQQTRVLLINFFASW